MTKQHTETIELVDFHLSFELWKLVDHVSAREQNVSFRLIVWLPKLFILINFQDSGQDNQITDFYKFRDAYRILTT